MLPSNEQRRFHRMRIECPASFRVIGEREFAGAIVKNLSSGGVLLWLDRWMAPGATMQIHIEPASTITPPLDASVRVLRCEALKEDRATWAAACVIEHLFDGKA